MDVKCPKCGEPWEMDCGHEVAADRVRELHPTGTKKPHEYAIYQKVYQEVMAEFRIKGCKVFGGKCSDNKANPGVAILYELLGDDMDGAAAMIEDFEGSELWNDLESDL